MWAGLPKPRASSRPWHRSWRSLRHHMRELLPIHGAHPCRSIERCHRSPDQSPISRTRNFAHLGRCRPPGIGPGQAILNPIDTAELAPWRDQTIYLGPPDNEISQPQYEALLTAAPSAPQCPVDEDDLAILLLTGGTTGRSKGVQLSHKNVHSNGMQMAIAMGAVPTDIYLHAAPMFHAADLLSTGFTLVGAAHCYLPVFSPTASLEVIQKISRYGDHESAHHDHYEPHTNSRFEEYDTSSLRIMLYGSSPMAAEWVQKSIEGFPHTQIVQGYGLTETSPILTYLGWDIHKNAIKAGDTNVLRSVYRPFVGLDMKITDDNGDELPLGEVGEVTVRGPQVSRGYLNRPEETEKSFRKWLVPYRRCRLYGRRWSNVFDGPKEGHSDRVRRGKHIHLRG